jgi:ABC-2 type transport system ATP-binding protein
MTVAGLTKTYRRVSALDDVGFSLRRGEVLGLIGPNGAGKTTLFECLAGLLPRDAGTVRIEGRIVPATDSSLHMFYLPDAIAPWPAQPVGWALEFITGFFGGPADRWDQVIRRLNLDAFLDRRIGTLSKGQRKRALLAIGLLTPQPVLLVDEPFDGLDLRQTREVAATIREHASEGRTIVLSIHQISDAARVCDRFVLLSAGQVRGEGTLDELAAAAEARGTASRQGLEEVFLALT